MSQKTQTRSRYSQEKREQEKEERRTAKRSKRRSYKRQRQEENVLPVSDVHVGHESCMLLRRIVILSDNTTTWSFSESEQLFSQLLYKSAMHTSCQFWVQWLHGFPSLSSCQTWFVSSRCLIVFRFQCNSHICATCKNVLFLSELQPKV